MYLPDSYSILGFLIIYLPTYLPDPTNLPINESVPPPTTTYPPSEQERKEKERKTSVTESVPLLSFIQDFCVCLLNILNSTLDSSILSREKHDWNFLSLLRPLAQQSIMQEGGKKRHDKRVVYPDVTSSIFDSVSFVRLFVKDFDFALCCVSFLHKARCSQPTPSLSLE